MSKFKFKVKFEDAGLNKALSKLKAARLDAGVGIFGDSENAMKLATNAFGSFVKNIPARDPLFEPMKNNKEDIINVFRKKFFQALKGEADSKQAVRIALDKTAFYVLNTIVKRQILTNGEGKWKALTEETIKRKEGSKQMLIDSKSMFNALTFKILNSI